MSSPHRVRVMLESTGMDQFRLMAAFRRKVLIQRGIDCGFPERSSPTCVEFAGATCPTEYHGNAIPPLEGISLAPAFADQLLEREAMYWEHENNRAIRMGDWKLVKRGDAKNWELYNLADDRTETSKLAEREPERVREMSEAWEAWAKRAHALPKPKKG